MRTFNLKCVDSWLHNLHFMKNKLLKVISSFTKLKTRTMATPTTFMYSFSLWTKGEKLWSWAISNQLGSHMMFPTSLLQHYDSWWILKKMLTPSCLESKNDGITTPFHYEKLFLWKLHYPSIKCLMQLVCNYATFFPWKCEAFKTKMPLKNSQVLWQLHISSKMDPYTILIHPIYMIVINVFSLCWQGA